MLLPDGVEAKKTVYWVSSMILKFLKEYKERNWINLFIIMKEKLDIQFTLYSYSLNWLYLIEEIDIDFENGGIIKCF